MTSKKPRSLSLDQDIVEELKRRDDYNASGDVNDYLRRRLFGDDSDKRRDLAQLEHMMEKAKDELDDAIDEVEKHARRLRDLQEEYEELQSPEVDEDVEQCFKVIRGMEGKYGAEERDWKTQANKAGMRVDVFKEKYEVWRDAREEEEQRRHQEQERESRFKSIRSVDTTADD